jgi:hypothetical protein
MQLDVSKVVTEAGLHRAPRHRIQRLAASSKHGVDQRWRDTGALPDAVIAVSAAITAMDCAAGDRRSDGGSRWNHLAANVIVFCLTATRWTRVRSAALEHRATGS